MYLERLFFVLFKYILPCRSSPEGILKIKFLRLSFYSKLAFSHGEHKKVNKIQGFSISSSGVQPMVLAGVHFLCNIHQPKAIYLNKLPIQAKRINMQERDIMYYAF